MTQYSEHRLIHYKIADIEKQRKAAGASPISTKVVDPSSRTYSYSTPTGASVSSAAANATRQQAVYQAANPGVAKLPAYDPLTAPPSIEVVTPGGTIGYDPRNFTAVTDPETGQVTGVNPISRAPSVIPKGAPAGYVDTAGVGRITTAGIQESDAEYAARLASIEQRNLALLQQEQLKKQGKPTVSTIAPTSVGAPTFNPYGNRTSAEGVKANLDRQGFIEQQRGLGKSDAEIRQMIQTMPPEQTGGVTPTTSSVTTPPTATTGSTTTTTGSVTPTKDTTGSTTTTPKPTTGGAVQPSPQANILRQMAALEADPYTRLYLNSAADQLDAIGTPQDPMGQAEFLQGEDAKAISSPYDAIQGILNNANTQAKNSEASTKAFLQGQLNRTNAYNAAQKENIQNQLQYAQDKATRDQTDANKKALDAQTIMLALRGGFGSADGNNEINEARLKGEEAIINLQKEFGFKKTDVSLKFTELHNQAFDNYQTSWLAATDNFEQKVNNIALQGISNQQAKGSALSGAYKDYVKEIKDSRIEYAKTVQGATEMVRQAHKEEKQAQIDKEDRALNQISSLLNNFPESEVRDIILGLGKDVTSFSVEDMLNAKSNVEVEQARKAALARQVYAASQLALKQANAPVITKDEFINKKIAEKELALGQSMNEKLRSEYINANADFFDSQYDQLTAPTFQNVTSGSTAVDAATDAYLRGDFPSIKEAAKTYGVSPSDVSTYAGKLRTEGAKVGDIRALQAEQAKELSTLRKTIDDNDVTKKLNVMDSAIPKIGVARSSLTGVGDVALLNFYQNGIVDPGLAVRAEDATLLRKASALKDKITPQFASDVLLKGAFFPDETRKQMEEIAKGVYEATQKVYQEKVFTPTVEQAQQSGIGAAYFNYKKREPIEIAPIPTSATDDYLNTFGL